jgi:preprotein translocase subunit YajC
MTVTHFIICSIATFPIAYLMRWMDHTAAGILLYFGIFVVIYVIIWCSQYTKMKQKVQAMNKKLSETK